MGMRRSSWLALTLLVLSAALVEAQRAGGPSHGGGSGAPGGGGARVGPSSGVLHGRPGFGYRRHYYGYGVAWLPWDWGFWDDGYVWDESSYQPSENMPPPQIIVVEKKEEPRPPAAPPKIIEAPLWKEAPAAKRLPPTLFVLNDGERLESRYYLLTADSLQIEVARQERTIPLSDLNLDATLALNQQRGVELTIPHDRNTLFLGF